MTDTQAMTIRIPRPVHDQLRQLAYEARKPMNEIVLAAISAALKRQAEAS